MTGGKFADVHALDEIVLEPGSFYVMDRGYLDQARLYLFVLVGAFFITRAKRRMRFSRLESRPVDRTTGLRCDQIVSIGTIKGASRYPGKLRRVGFRDPESGRVFVFLTNNFDLPALSIAHLYKLRWRVELFFKWIKGHLCVSKRSSARAETRFSHRCGRPSAYLPHGCHPEKATRAPSESLHDSADFEHSCVFARDSLSIT